VKTKRNAKLIEDLARKKGDLPFVVILKIEVAIPADAVPGHAFDRRHFNCGIRVWFASVVSYKIVTWRDVQVTDFHRRNDITRGFSSRGNFSINRGPAAGIIEPRACSDVCVDFGLVASQHEHGHIVKETYEELTVQESNDAQLEHAGVLAN